VGHPGFSCSPVEREGDGEQRERRGETARCDIGIEEHKGGGGDGQRPPDSEQGDAAELDGVAGEAAAQQQACCEQCKGDAEELDQHQHPLQGQVRETDDRRDERSEEREAEMRGDESGVVRKERGVQQVFDAGDVEAAVFSKGVVAVHQQRGQRERCEDGEPACGAPTRGVPRVMCARYGLYLRPRSEGGKRSHEARVLKLAPREKRRGQDGPARRVKLCGVRASCG